MEISTLHNYLSLSGIPHDPSLLKGFDFFGKSSLRFHRLLTKSEIVDYEHLRFWSFLDSSSEFAISMVDGGLISAYSGCFEMDWDSAHFKQPMARLECGFSSEVSNSYAKKFMSDFFCRENIKKYSHISAFVDADDYFKFNLLAGFGFELMDTRQLFVSRSAGAHVVGERLCHVRPYVSHDLSAIERLAFNAYFPSRYSRDSSLSELRTREMYMKRMSNLAALDSDKRLLFVAERDGVTVGCGGVERLDINVSGDKKIYYGNSMLVCSPDISGAAYSIVGRVIKEGLNECGFLEFAVSLNNTPLRRILNAQGCEHAVSVHCLRLAV